MFKYGLLSDLNYLFNEKRKLLLTYLIIIILLAFSTKILGFVAEDIFFAGMLGYNFSFDNSIIETLSNLFSFSFIIYVTIILFNKDIVDLASNIFLRVKSTTWLKWKLINIAIITFILKIITFIIFTTIFHFIYNVNLHNLYHLFFIDYLYILIVEIIFIVLYLICKKCKIAAGIFIVLGIILFKYIPFKIISISKYFMFLIPIYIVLFIISIVVFKSIHNDVFENN